MALTVPNGWEYLADTDAHALERLRGLRGDPFPEADYTDPELLEGLDVAAREFERATGGRVFVARSGTLQVRGEGGRTLWLSEPLIDVTAVRIAGEAIDLDALDVNGGTDRDGDGEDPRNDPWIAWRSDAEGAAYLSGIGGWARASWPAPELGPIVEIDGSFGFVEADGRTPPLVAQAVILLLQRGLVPVNDVEGRGDYLRGAVIQEQTRGRGYMLAQGRLSSGVFLDREIDRIVATYKRPERVTVSRSRRPGRDRRPPLY